MQPVAEDGTDLELAARSTVNVLVTAGDGEDRARFARLIHDRSSRRNGPFVTASVSSEATECQAIRPLDIEDWFAQAAGGTLFIDRIGDLRPEAQARLFALLNQQLDYPGVAAPVVSNGHVRVLCGSDRSLEGALAAGAFSDALFYRLNVIHIELAPRVTGSE